MMRVFEQFFSDPLIYGGVAGLNIFGACGRGGRIFRKAPSSEKTLVDRSSFRKRKQIDRLGRIISHPV